MKYKPRLFRIVTCAIVSVVVASMSVVLGGTAQAATPSYQPAACNTPTPQTRNGVPVASCFALGYTDSSGSLEVRPAIAGPPSTALGPSQIQDAYKLPDAGAGMTVAVVDAYGYANAEADLATFRSYYGLPACTTDNGCFTKVDQRGGTDFPEDDGGWSVETALDLDAVSSVCPKCKILLVEGDTAGFDDLGQAVNTAASMGAVAISNSYGFDGEFSDEQQYDQYYDHAGIAVTVSSGDSGNVQSWPSTDPNVIAVGGTRLTADSSTRGWTETAWNSAGSGCSLYEPRPDYQAAISTNCPNHKAAADISGDADPVSGLAVYNTEGQSGWAQWGGTSLASPLVAAMYALAGKPTPGTYPVTYPYLHAADLNDVTAGTNGSCGNVLCQAGPGWDGPTGLGTPGLSALTLGESGEVSGVVTAAGSGAPISGAAVSATDANGNRFHATTATDGSYDLYAPVGTYDITATKFGYADLTMAGVKVTTAGPVTEDFALTAKPSKTISGTVTDGSGHGWPMRAKITIDGYPNGAIYSDPTTGHYSVSLPTGSSYTMHVTSADLPGYTTQDATVNLTGSDVRQDIALKVNVSTCTAPGYAYHDDGTTETFTGWQGDTPQDGWTITDNAGTGQVWRFDNPGGWDAPPGGDAYFADIDSNKYGEGGVQNSDLVSPVVDLTGKVSPEIGIDSTYIGFPDQHGSVDLSLDGGATWSTVWTPYSVNPGHVDIPIPQAAGQSQVRVRFHFDGSWSRRWEIDNVLIGARSCAPQPGGLVVGTVTDANNGDALNGATVVSDVTATESGVTMPTPDDVGLTDGYYSLFSSHTGQTAFTVTDGQYAPTHASVDVPADAVRRADFKLDAGHLTLDTQSVSLSEELGATKSQTITFGNDGTAPVHVNLGEADAGFTQMGTAAPAARASGAPTTVIKTETSRAANAATATASGTGSQPAPRQASPAQGPWTDVADYPTPVMDDAVAYHDGKIYVVGGYDGVYRIATAGVYDPAAGGWTQLADLPEAVSAASAGFVGDTLYVVGGWTNAGASTHAYAYHLDTNTWTRVADLPGALAAAGSAVVAGKLYVIGGCTSGQCVPTSAAVYSYDPGNNSWNREPDYPTPVAFVACGGVTAKVVCAGGNGGGTSTYVYTPGTSGWAKVADLPVDAWGAASATANGMLEVMGGAIDNGGSVTNQGFAYDPSTNSWTALPNANNATYRGGAACGIYKVGGSAGGFNTVQFTEHLPGYEQCGGDVTWMSEDKTAFDVTPGQSVTVHITADSSTLSQPGTYAGLLTVSTNSPYGMAGPVKVTLQVTPPKKWGKVAGTVLDSSGAPIAGATVAVCTMYDTRTGACGPTTYTLKTDGSGHYQLWLSSGFNPLQIIAAKDGYTPLMKIAHIRKGATTTVDFTLSKSSDFTQAKVRAYLNTNLYSKVTK